MFNHKLNFKKYTRCLMAMGMSVLGCIGTVDGTMAYAQEIDDGPVIGDLTLLPESASGWFRLYYTAINRFDGWAVQRKC